MEGAGPGLGWMPEMTRRRRIRARDRRWRIVLRFDQPNGGKDPLVKADENCSDENEMKEVVRVFEPSSAYSK